MAEEAGKGSKSGDYEALVQAFNQLSAPRRPSTRAERRAAAQAGLGMLKDLPPAENELAQFGAQSGIREDAEIRRTRVKVIKTTADVGDDRMLHIRLPFDSPIGRVDVIATVEPVEQRPSKRRRVSRSTQKKMIGLIRAMSETDKQSMSEEQRRAAAAAGFGALRTVPGTVEEFLAERRLEEAWREMRLARGFPP